MVNGSSALAEFFAWAFFGAGVFYFYWLATRSKRLRQRQPAPPSLTVAPENKGEDRDPGGPLTEMQALNLFETILQAAVSQKADTILIDDISGRPKARLRTDGHFQELTGIGDPLSFRRLVAQAKCCAGLPTSRPSLPAGRGSFYRFNRHGHLRNSHWRIDAGESRFAFQEIARRDRAVRFDLELFSPPGRDIVKIAVKPARPAEKTQFDLGFEAAAEDRFIQAVRSRSGIVLLTGPCNSGKSTATYRALSLLRDAGKKVITVEWPIEAVLPGIVQYRVGEGNEFDAHIGLCLRRAIKQNPDVLMVQNIDWIDGRNAQLAIDFAASGGLLISAVHITGCANGLSSLLWRHFTNQRKDLAELLKAVVSPRRLFMICAHCAEEYRVPARILIGAGISDPPIAADGRVATWRGRGCSYCENTGELGSTAVYEVMDLGGKMRRFLENANDWNSGQIEYLERQAWLHGMRTQRELALERVLAGDISLQQALLNTIKPKWLTAAQAARVLKTGS
jgi:type II secretory ATPase GspE/PulE/Tfp pilus assembly ATPase PilB-like protein